MNDSEEIRKNNTFNEDLLILHDIEKQLTVLIPEVTIIRSRKLGFKFTKNHITELSLISVNSQDVLDKIFRLRYLEKLVLVETELTYIPDSIGNLTQLSDLSLKENSLEFVPDKLLELPNLKYLNLSNNKLKSFMTIEGQLSVLRTLELENNHLIKVKFEENSGFLIENLFLSNNEITDLTIDHLVNLEFLSAQFNHLSRIPEIKELKKLNTLELDFNIITDFRIDLDKLPFLVNFSISYNKISKINFSNAKLIRIPYFFFDGNKLDKDSKRQLHQYSKTKGLKTNFIIFD